MRSDRLALSFLVIVCIVLICTGPVLAETAPVRYVFNRSWGSSGSGDGQFNSPAAIATDWAGNVYVSDTYNNRIQVFAPDGTFFSKWGSAGTGNGQFNLPHGIAVSGLSNVYVADYGNSRIQRFSSSGSYISQWGTNGSGDGQFYHPAGLDISPPTMDSWGMVYVADLDNDRVQYFDIYGNYAGKWGSSGSSDGQFSNPSWLTVNPSWEVSVVDVGNFRIQKFYGGGNFITTWGSWGTGDGQYRNAMGIASDGDGNIFITDYQNHRVQMFSKNGTFLTKWGTEGSGNGQFSYPTGIAVDASGHVYVADLSNRIQKFDPVSAGTVHNLNTNRNYTTIQGAINANETLAGHIIAVDSGTYHEGVEVNKSVTIRGNNTGAGIPVIDGDLSGGSIFGFFIRSDHSRLDRFFITNFSYAGVKVVQGRNVSVSNVTAFWNTVGLHLCSENTTAINNTLVFNGNGIDLEGAFNNVVANSTIRSSGEHGIWLLGGSTGNIVHSNVIANSTVRGIDTQSAGGSLFYNNNISNANNVLDDGYPNNRWNITRRAGRNIAGGPVLGGNLWSNYNGSDTNSDGLGDTFLPYRNVGNITIGGDYLPLTRGPFSAPITKFSANVTLGTAPLPVTFSDTSTGSPAAWRWTFGDGNTSALQHPVHTYKFPGTFTVSLNATNPSGSNTSVRAAYITVLQTRDAAYSQVLARVLNGSTSGISVYASKFPVPASATVTEWDSALILPAAAGWLFFIDDYPRANWEHPCRYVFIDNANTITQFTGYSPPANILLDRIAGIPPFVDSIGDFGGLSAGGQSSSPAPGIAGHTTGSSTCDPTYQNCYALLVSGGYNATYNYKRYSADLSFMYKTLVSEYGYQPDHITVLMSDGTSTEPDRRIGDTTDTPPLPKIDNSPTDFDGDGTADVDGTATRADVLSALGTLKSTLHDNDHLFIFTTNHGGNNTVPRSGKARLWLWNGEYLWDHELVAELNTIPAKAMTVTMEQCFSGGFIDDIVTYGNKSHAWVIATAANADEPSYANDFSYPWISAVAGHEPDETPVDADADDDGHVSMLEAFDFARANDQSAQYLAEHPQFRDYIAGNGSRLYLNSCSVPPADTLTVTAPASGDVWKTGMTPPISWTYTGMCGGNVRITLWKGGAGGGFQREIAPSVAVTAGSYSWPIPRSVSPSTRYWINISSTKTPDLYDASDGALTITASPPCTLSKPLVTLPGYTRVPTDPNEDCIYEDLNANGRPDFADVVLYFNQMSWIAANEPVEGFDLNYNGRIDFADIVVLFSRI